MDVSRISPAPSCSSSAIHSTPLRAVASRPPVTYTVQAGVVPPAGASRRTSTAATTHWVPKLPASRPTRAGSRTAAVFTATLSAPARSAAPASSTERIPPPTVNGMKMASDTRETISSVVSCPSWLAVMSRNTSSSAPSAS